MAKESKQLKINFRRNYRVLTFATLGLLAFCFLFLVMADNDLANIVAAFIYLFLSLLVVLQIFEYLWQPEIFDRAPSDKKSVLVERISLLKSREYRSTYQKRYWRWQRVINLAVMVVFFVVFGVTASIFKNFWSLVSLVLVLTVVNFLLFYYDFADPNNFVTKRVGNYLKSTSRENYEIFRQYFSKRNNVLILIVNFCVLMMFLMLFGFSLVNYGKLLSFGFILFIINSVLILDAKNDEEYYR
ncbi:MAG: hypothetical protein HUU49_01265 [Candidatus Buchananbacteria bacterium]|nr:hypothetical protein [Candidatus Buchananbacteria bacterium]